jgi:hypothetical protein
MKFVKEKMYMVVDPVTYTCTSGTLKGETRYMIRLEVKSGNGTKEVQLVKVKYLIKDYDEQVFQSLMQASVDVRQSMLRFTNLIA